MSAMSGRRIGGIVLMVLGGGWALTYLATQFADDQAARSQDPFMLIVGLVLAVVGWITYSNG